MGTTVSEGQRRDARNTRRRLLEAAAALFAERGYERATVRDIADRAGVNQALLFRYFGSKRALFGEVIAHNGEEQLRTTPPHELLEAALRGLLGHGGREPGSRALATLLRSVDSGDEIGTAVRAISDDYARVLASLSSADNHELRADLALSWLLGIGMMRVLVGKEPLADADPNEVCALVTSALGTLLDGLPAADGRR
ncbi:TetR/AcrR family transcriptional regulator [Streptomyces iranensis]|uniref:AcrR family transcriptional regulator n=1 Tax=Streptomyces iranensis TaxID=576784 RepID=A0A061A9V6_9ACTN|nr:TetR/AcrR family transcriptional regulator [Streptomyces iranensis]MBP2064074.1 AcrR family transcriptional regulator [Streptomyces iranensis]CDR17001.1 regulatory protein TetR [Streptomyces iranensis]